MYKKINHFLILILIYFLMQGCITSDIIFDDKTIIDEGKALVIAKDFVNNHMKLYTHSENIKLIKEASIIVTDIQKKNNEWIIELHIISEVNNEKKKAGLIVVINSNTGEIKKEKLKQFRLREK